MIDQCSDLAECSDVANAARALNRSSAANGVASIDDGGDIAASLRAKAFCS